MDTKYEGMKNFSKHHSQLKMVFKVTLCFLFVLVVVFFSLVYYNLGSEHFDGINSYSDALYYATMITSTVGFGDVHPKTEAGKAVTTLNLFSVILVVFLVIVH